MNYNEGELAENRIEEPKSGKSKLLSAIIWILVAVILALGAFFFTNNYIVKQPISGTSMMPTIHDKDCVLLFRTKKVKYDDIIVFESETLGKNLIKRVIGKSGDEIKTVFSAEDEAFHVYRNGELVSEAKIKEPMSAMGGFKEDVFVVPDGYLYVLGDNRNNSYDSNDGILAAEKEVVGVAFLRIAENGALRLL